MILKYLHKIRNKTRNRPKIPSYVLCASDRGKLVFMTLASRFYVAQYWQRVWSPSPVAGNFCVCFCLMLWLIKDFSQKCFDSDGNKVQLHFIQGKYIPCWLNTRIPKGSFVEIGLKPAACDHTSKFFKIISDFSFRHKCVLICEINPPIFTVCLLSVWQKLVCRIPHFCISLSKSLTMFVVPILANTGLGCCD